MSQLSEIFFLNKLNIIIKINIYFEIKLNIKIINLTKNTMLFYFFKFINSAQWK